MGSHIIWQTASQVTPAQAPFRVGSQGAYVCNLYFSPLGVGLSPASACSTLSQFCAAESSNARFSASRQPWTAATACKGHRSRHTLAAQRQQAAFEAAFLSLEDGSYSHLLPVVSKRRAKQVTSWTSCIGSLASAVGSLSTTRSHVVQGKRKRNSCVVNASSLEAIDYTVSSTLISSTLGVHRRSCLHALLRNMSVHFKLLPVAQTENDAHVSL